MARHDDMRCPACGGQLVEVERSGVHIDACRQCRGVWLDRGELDRVLERERQVVAGVDDDEESFIRDVTGRTRVEARRRPGTQAAERLYSDCRTHRKHKKRKSFLDELFD